MKLERMQSKLGHEGWPIAIKIRCAGAGGRCGRLRAFVLICPQNTPGGVVLAVTTEGTSSHRKGFPPVVTWVDDPHGGIADNVICSKGEHNEFIQDGVIIPSWASAEEGRFASSGAGVCLDTSSLYEPYLKFRRTGATQSVRWTMGRGSVWVPPQGPVKIQLPATSSCRSR